MELWATHSSISCFEVSMKIALEKKAHVCVCVPASLVHYFVEMALISAVK